MRSLPSCLRQHLAQTHRPPSSPLEASPNRSPHLPSTQPCTRRLFGRCAGSQSAGATFKRRQNLSNVSPEKRRQDLVAAGFLEYPRADQKTLTSVHDVIQRLRKNQGHGDAVREYDVVGRISSVRSAGSDLVFIDVEERSTASLADGTEEFQAAPSQDRAAEDKQSAGTPASPSRPQRQRIESSPREKQPRLQVVLDRGKLSAHLDDGRGNPVKAFSKLVQRGDTIAIRGAAYSTASGHASLRATAMPKLLSPCLHQIPTTAISEDSDFAHDRHVQMLIEPAIADTLEARSKIVRLMHDFFDDRGFVHVQTPILAASAGGAAARPFETAATEFSDRKLALRIAPELWLKRLIIGGMQRVYEIGPSFRNEGLDKTHNPEFTTAEFYAVSWTLQKLQNFTYHLIGSLALDASCSHAIVEPFLSCVATHQGDTASTQVRQWPEIDFIPALIEALGITLPDLSSATAREELLDIFKAKHLPIPSAPTLPRLLDKLSSIYLEPRCTNATWIVNTPECLSPLAKSYPHSQYPQFRVAARAELFILQKEVVNCYEEENSPVEQRRKFLEQQKYARLDGDRLDPEAMKVDEDYIRALEWGLPPTGGWGCGIDRLCMLMLGKDKINDVLAFGNLRMVAKGAEKRAGVVKLDE